MASGKFVWILGNDDLILSNSLSELERLLEKYGNLDFFFINSYNLKSSEVFKYRQPFETKNLPSDMKKFSLANKDQIVSFDQLIDPKISFDFLLGLYLSIFKRDKWNSGVSYINQKDLNDKRTFSTFQNTCPHITIFANSFFKSKCFIKSDPLSVNLSGEREWVNLYSFIELVRIPEAIDCYFKSGLSFKKYFYCKNYSLRNFIPLLVKTTLKGKKE